MKKILFVPVLASLCAAAGAQEVGTVLSSVPVVQQVAVPRQVCQQQPMVVEQPTTGAGAVIGAIAGGAIGNSIGGGSGRAAATAIGVLGGAMLGNSIERNGAQVQNVPYCTTQTFYENRTVGYSVTYEYAGRQYTTQLPYDPGPTIRLQVTPVGSSAPVDQPYGYAPPPVVTAPPVYVAPQQVVPVYAPRPYAYPPVGVSLHFGYGRHSHRH